MTAMTSRGSQVKAFARRWGWPRTLYRLVMKIAGDYLGIHVVLVRGRCTTTEISCPIKLPDIELRQIDPDTLMSAIADPQLDLDREFIEAALERGDLAFGAFDQSVLVAYTWRSTTSAPHTHGLWVRADRPYCYAYKSFTRRDYRGNHILPALILYSDREMLRLDFTHRIGFIAVTNFASLAIGDYIGSHTFGYAGYLEWFGRYFTFRTKALTKTGFEFFTHGNQSREG